MNPDFSLVSYEGRVYDVPYEQQNNAITFRAVSQLEITGLSPAQQMF